MPRKKKAEEKEEGTAEEPLIREISAKEKREKKAKETKKEKKEKEEKEKVEEIEPVELKEKEALLVPLEDYIRAGVHLGTRAVMPDMRKYVYRRKADGIAVLNTKKVDEKIAVAATFLAQYEPKDTLVCCKRDAGQKALEAFKEALGVKTFARYPAGIITNSNLENFFEPKCLFIIDPWLDKNALHDAAKIHIPIVGLCDTNNMTTNIDVVVPCNNKAAKSIGLVLYIIAKLYLEKKGIKKKLNPKDFYELEETDEEKERNRQKVEKRAEELLKKLRRKKAEQEEARAEAEKVKTKETMKEETTASA